MEKRDGATVLHNVKSLVGARSQAVVAALSFCIWLWHVPAHGQYRSTQWTAEDGLPQNSVRGIAQTSDGYLWVATLNGLARFDGIRFTVFDKSNTPGLTSNRIIAMVRGAGDELWLASEDGNVVRHDKGRFEQFGPENGVQPHSVKGIATDGRGGITILSESTILGWNPIPGNSHPLPRFLTTTASCPCGGPGRASGICAGQNFAASSGAELRTYTLPTTFPLADVGAVAVGGDDVVWIRLTGGRHARISGGQIIFAEGTVETPFKGKRQTWAASVEPNFQRRLKLPSDGTEELIPYNVIRDDNEGNVWVGSEGRGLFRIQEQSIRTYSTAHGLAGANVYPVLEGRNGDIWIGTWPAGVSRIRDGAVTTFSAAHGVPGPVTSLAEDAAGRLWIGSHGGVVILESGTLRKPTGLPANMPTVQAILPLAGEAMMLGTPNGVYLADGQRSRWLTSQTGLAIDDARVIVQARNGDIWIGGYGGLTRLRGGTFERWTQATGLPGSNVRAIYEDASGDIWIGTYDDGLGRFRNGTWSTINRSNGLFDNGAFQILEDARGNFWISSNRGIYRVPKQQLNEFVDGRRHRVESVAYGRSDGMLSIECNGGLWPAGAKDSRGRLWFPTQAGVAVVDPDLLQAVTVPPKVAIEAIAVEGTELGVSDAVTLRPGQSHLTIHYTALSYSKPEQIIFRYRLDGVDTDWRDVGSARTANYASLPPGSHRFRVIAVNSDGVHSASEGTLAVTVIPPFYRRTWFILSLGLATAALISLAWSYRVRQLLAKQAAQQVFARQLIASQEQERRRIAADLHDSLGQRLVVINNLARLLLRNKPGSSRYGSLGDDRRDWHRSRRGHR